MIVLIHVSGNVSPHKLSSESQYLSSFVSAARAGVVLLEYSLFFFSRPHPLSAHPPSPLPVPLPLSFSLPVGVCLDGEIVGKYI